MSMQKTEPQWIEVTATGEDTGEEYFGKFYVKPFLTKAEKRDAAALTERYCLGIVDAYERTSLYQLALLKFHVVKSEAVWWKNDGLDLHDEAPANQLAARIAEVRQDRNPSLKAKNESNGETANVENAETKGE